MTPKSWISLWILLYFVEYGYSLENNTTDITCVPLFECPLLLKLLKKRPLPHTNTEFLKSVNCGYVNNYPKVWCPNIKQRCKTPDFQTGYCIPIKECKPYIQLLKTSNLADIEIKDYLQGFRCGDLSNKHICCADSMNIKLLKNANPLLPNHKDAECGQQNIIPKLVGGNRTEIDEFPWTALIQYDQDSENVTACGGVLISNRYVVTAAHCVDASAIRQIGTPTNIILGEYDISSENDCVLNLDFEDCAAPLQIISIEEITYHPGWDSRLPGQVNHDIALIRLESAVTFSDFVKPICLPEATLVIKETETLFVSGWGKTETTVESQIKLKLAVPLVNRSTCAMKYKQSKKITLGNGMICAGGEEGKDSCTGDSGGPLMLPINRDSAQVWFLAGVVSFGFNAPCGEKDYPGMYTYIPKYIEWIYQTVQP